MPLETGNRSDKEGMFNDTSQHSRNQKLLIIADDEVSAKLLGYIFELNAYKVLATSDLQALFASRWIVIPAVFC